MKYFGANDGVNALSVDEMAIVFSFLPPTHILRARVCTTWRDAARKAIVPLCDFKVIDVRSYNALRAMSSALPNLQQLRIEDLDDGHKYSDGEDPDEDLAAETAHHHTCDINVISNFKKLRELSLQRIPMNGIYPVLFNFPLLQSLEMTDCFDLKWDLSMLSGCPQIRRLRVYNTDWHGEPTGDLNDLRVLRDTLEELELSGCYEVSGNLMDLADFPYLKVLDLSDTYVTGDIRDIGRDDFQSIETQFLLPPTIVGGCDYVFQRISDVPSFMESIRPLLKREHILNLFFKYEEELSWRLSRYSPDWYDSLNNDDDERFPEPPFYISFVRVGPRLGWRWGDAYDDSFFRGHCCEINWLDPEPSRQSKDYATYINELQKIERRFHLGCFRGYRQPPTEEEYIRIYDELLVLLSDLR